MTRDKLRAYITDPFLRRLLDAPDPPEPTAEELAAKRADLERRIDADIAESRPRPVPGLTHGVIEVR